MSLLMDPNLLESYFEDSTKEFLHVFMSILWLKVQLYLFFPISLSLTVPSFIYCHHTLGEGNGTPLQYSCLENLTCNGSDLAAAAAVSHTEKCSFEITVTISLLAASDFCFCLSPLRVFYQELSLFSYPCFLAGITTSCWVPPLSHLWSEKPLWQGVLRQSGQLLSPLFFKCSFKVTLSVSCSLIATVSEITIPTPCKILWFLLSFSHHYFKIKIWVYEILGKGTNLCETHLAQHCWSTAIINAVGLSGLSP